MAEIDTEYTRGCILTEALRVINGERQDAYGSPENNFSTIAGFWKEYLAGKYDFDFALSPDDVGIMMALMKIARIITGTATHDSFVDAAGYIGLAADLSAEYAHVHKGGAE